MNSENMFSLIPFMDMHLKNDTNLLMVADVLFYGKDVVAMLP